MQYVPDDKPEAWWAEYEQFLRENRFSFREDKVDWGEEYST